MARGRGERDPDGVNPSTAFHFAVRRRRAEINRSFVNEIKFACGEGNLNFVRDRRKEPLSPLFPHALS